MKKYLACTVLLYACFSCIAQYSTSHTENLEDFNLIGPIKQVVDKTYSLVARFGEIEIDELRYQSVATFNEEGLPTTITSFSSNDEMSHRAIVHLNSVGRQISKDYYTDGVLVETVETEYIGEEVVLEKAYDSQGNLELANRYEYDSYGNVTTHATYKDDGTLNVYRSFEYDSLGRLNALTEHSDELTSKKTFAYYENYVVAENRAANSNYLFETQTAMYHPSFNHSWQHLLLSYKESYGTTRKYEYEFDGYGNITRRTEYEQVEKFNEQFWQPVEVATYMYEYY